jgi:predicted ATPase
MRVEQWRQFDYVDIDIHQRLTVLTGANGSGKTTLLGLLAQHFGWSRSLLATPWRHKDGSTMYVTGALKNLATWLERKDNSQTPVGRITYSNGTAAELFVPPSGNIQYNVQISGQQTVSGLSIPSHRVLSHYQQISSIPTLGINAQQAFSNYQTEIIQRFNGMFHSGSSPIFKMKEALISMATFGEGNRYVKGKPELLQAYLGFINVLKKILPESLGFETIEIRTPDVVLVTKSGEFLLDAVSGGISALIDLAWQIHTFSHESGQFVVIIDEPENHLHPSMQRALLPSLLTAFPEVQFIVASHSPFIVTSVKDSSVYVLAYRESNDDGEFRGIAPPKSVYSTRLDQINKAGSANEILRTVLGLDSTMPLWASKELDSIVSRYRSNRFTGDQVEQLNNELEAIGMAECLPSAIDAIVKEGNEG